MDNEKLEKYLALAKEFRNAMLVTQRGSELRSRPMVIADVTNDGRLWFLTGVDSGKVDELTEEPFVNVAMQSGESFLSISGTAVVLRDRNRLDELWSPAYGIWFPDGKDDPSLAVAYVAPTYVEYWDSSGKEVIETMLELGKAAVTGEEPSFSRDVHGKLDLPDKT